MSERRTEPAIPAPIRWAFLSLVGLSLVAATVGRLSGWGTVQVPEGPAAVSREIAFLDRKAGGVEVRDASTGTTIDVIKPGEGGFVRGVIRSVARERRLAGLGQDRPVRVVRHRDGRLSVVDDATGRRIELDAFGPTNAQAFARYLASDNNREGKS
jgi:putative photosynthetic complex assembly protein